MSDNAENIAEQLVLLQERMNNLEDNQCYEMLLDRINNIENNSEIRKDELKYYKEKYLQLKKQNKDLKLLLGIYNDLVSQIQEINLCSRKEDAKRSI